MNCARCNNPIPPERLEAVPDAAYCVACLKLSGDVPRNRGVLVYEHKTGGALQVVALDQFNALRQAEGAIEERVSRL